MAGIGNEKGNLGFVEHLAELRDRLIRSLWAVIIFSGIAFNYSGVIFDAIREPAEKYLTNGGLVFTSPADKFIAHIKISFFTGIILACPFWLYQVWKFVAPGLYAKERKYSLGFIISGTILFLGGVAFAYFITLPAAFHYLFTFGGDVDKPMITIDEYFSFMLWTTLMFGVAFELPVVIVILGMLGVVSQKFLRTKRRYAIVTLAIAAAILTPPDLLSMLFMLIPLVILYEISILIVGFFEKKKLESHHET